MPQWGTFAGLSGVVLVLLLALSHLTKSAFADPERNGAGASPREAAESSRTFDDRRSDAAADGHEVPPTDGERTDSGPVASDERERGRAETRRDERLGPRSMSTGELLANVALSQGLFAAMLIGAAVYTGIPGDALGIAFGSEYLLEGVVVGTGLGVALYVANELGAAGAERFGMDHDERLREMLAPESIGGWLVLLFLVLPIVAVFEEFLFRAALIGAVSAGFDISPWLLAAVSSVAFAVGHGIQGAAGIVVTGVLGFVLAVAFVLTGSLLVVIVAHYLINALEFVVHEGLEIDWAGSSTGGS